MAASQSTACPHIKGLPNATLALLPVSFLLLSEPTRLRLLNLLRGGERNVGDLAQLCGFTAANVSRHLAMLTQHGLVTREMRGTSAYFRIADESVYALCDLVCGNVARGLERSAKGREAFARSMRRTRGAKP